MSGQELIWLDVIVFMGVMGAWLAHLYCLPSCWRESRKLLIGSALRLCGWLIFAARFGYVLFTSGDLIIPLPSEIALIFLAVGDIWGVLARRKGAQK